MLLNTDWTAAGNVKTVRVENEELQFETDVTERIPKIITLLPGMALEPDDPALHLEITESGALRCHGTGLHRIIVRRPGNRVEALEADLTSTTVCEIGLR